MAKELQKMQDSEMLQISLDRMTQQYLNMKVRIYKTDRHTLIK